MYFTDSLMSSQMQENSIRYPQSTESGRFQHISQTQGIHLYNFLLKILSN